MKNFKGIIYAALSSSTFGLAPLFSILLLSDGFSSFEVLSYRWGVASLTLGIIGLGGCRFRISRQELCTVFFLSLFRAATSLSLVIAYQNISSGVASIIHFMYPLAVALAMMCFFREKGSVWVFAAIGMSIVGAVLLSLGNVDFTRGNTTLGMVSAAVSVVSYGGYIVGVRKSRAVGIDSTVLTCYVMGLGALYFIAGGLVTGGIRIETDGTAWLCILGVALPATAVSNMTLVQAIKRIGPTLTSVFGALEPLTAVVIGVAVFGEPFTVQGAAGILLIVAAVTIVILHSGRRKA
jgi:drug/metabolite transporter (DMT)-like permease